VGNANIVLMSQRIHVIDSHTAGEPTRVIVAGGPRLGSGSMRERLEIFRRDFDYIRSAVVNEPRGSDALVGALLCEPVDPGCSAGVIFFNNVGFLHMCGHGTIGLAVTLAHMGLIEPGVHKIETPAGVVEAELHENGEVTVGNVPSYRAAANVEVDAPPFGKVKGDVAWGGNWFFLTYDCPVAIELGNLEALTQYCWALRQALNAGGYPEIDHIEVYGPPASPTAHSRNFVLCPGKAYDRSPCGTGTSAKLACLYADGKLREGEIWRQESVIGSTFDGWVTVHDGQIHPHIRGAAFVNAEADLILEERDPFRWGIRNKAS
jgi:4-hydroxyproline epimerase